MSWIREMIRIRLFILSHKAFWAILSKTGSDSENIHRNDMVYGILNIFFTIIIIVLFIRYFIERYRYYGFGPIMVAIVTLTERLLLPIRRFLPNDALVLRDQVPLLAIGVTLILRGFAIWLFNPTFMTGVYIHNAFGGLSLVYAMFLSFSMGIELLSVLLVAFLFASVMISHRGVHMIGNAGFRCFQENTFAIFQFVEKIVAIDRLVPLFLISSSCILFAGALFSSSLSLTFVYGSNLFLMSFIISIFDMLLALINIYWFVLLLAIVSSWVGADHFSIVVQVIRALADPYLSKFRRWFPWARIDFIDLSPIFAFLLINPVLVMLLTQVKINLIQSINIVKPLPYI